MAEIGCRSRERRASDQPITTHKAGAGALRFAAGGNRAARGRDHRVGALGVRPSRLVERALRHRREIAQEPEQLALQATATLDDALGEIVADAGAVRREQVLEKSARPDEVLKAA